MVDLSFLEKFTKGDKKKMKRYINLYLDVAPKTFEEMQQNLKAKDWEQLRINAHSLKPQTDFMGIQELKVLLVNIEDTIKEGNQSVLEDLFNEALAFHKASEITLNDYLIKS